jgi:hypothetical protein
MEKELTKTKPQRSGFLVANTLAEAREVAALIASTSFLPKSYIDKQNKPKINEIIIAGSVGARHDLDMFQSVQAICVINNRPSMWGDYLIAIVQRHTKIEWIKEEFDNEKMIASCTGKRKGWEEQTRTFSKEDAQKANLWDNPSKKDTWGKYPKRMLQMRARGFLCRDIASDILQGISMAEEIRDTVDIQVREIPQDSLPDPKTLTTEKVPENDKRGKATEREKPKAASNPEPNAAEKDRKKTPPPKTSIQYEDFDKVIGYFQKCKSLNALESLSHYIDKVNPKFRNDAELEYANKEEELKNKGNEGGGKNPPW